MMDIETKLINIFEDTGIIIDKDSKKENLNLDSLHYISIICEIENEFDIEIPDEMLSNNPLETFSDFENMIEELERN